MSIARLCALALCALSSTAGAAPTITTLSVNPKSVAVGQAVTITIMGDDLENSLCALRLEFGDGSAEGRQMDWGKNHRFPLVVQTTYAKPGQYKVKVRGVKSGKALNCLGTAHATVQVVAPARKH